MVRWPPEAPVSELVRCVPQRSGRSRGTAPDAPGTAPQARAHTPPLRRNAGTRCSRPSSHRQRCAGLAVPLSSTRCQTCLCIQHLNPRRAPQPAVSIQRQTCSQAAPNVRTALRQQPTLNLPLKLTSTFYTSDQHPHPRPVHVAGAHHVIPARSRMRSRCGGEAARCGRARAAREWPNCALRQSAAPRQPLSAVIGRLRCQCSAPGSVLQLSQPVALSAAATVFNVSVSCRSQCSGDSAISVTR